MRKESELEAELESVGESGVEFRPEPWMLGLPERFESFRKQQWEVVSWRLESQVRALGAAMPTGSGKTLAAMAAAKALGERTAILTSTKGLQSQYELEFGGSGLVSIMGKSNYTCLDRPGTCRTGEHEGCRLARTVACNYEGQRWQAKQADIVLTNYAYWIRINERSRGLELTEKEGGGEGENRFGLLILDEGHAAFEELGKALQFRMRESVLRKAGIKALRTEDIEELSQWARDCHPRAEAYLASAAEALRKCPDGNPGRKRELRETLVEAEGLEEGLGKVAQMSPNYWVCQMEVGTIFGRQWVFDCIWPGAVAESRLFLGIPKLLFLSATLRPASMRMLGLREYADPENSKEAAQNGFVFREWPRVFPARNTPVVAHVSYSRHRRKPDGGRVQIGLNYRTSREDWEQVIRDTDEFIGLWKDKKGLIHSGSYERQSMLLEMSRWRHIMIGNTQDPDSPSAAQIVGEFKRASAPKILVSPSFATGWDFPGEECEWIIFLKVPIKPSKAKVVQARLERQPNYLDYLAMQELVQGSGRGTRSPEDRCLVLIKDANIFWFLRKNQALKPRWFEVRRVVEMPKPWW